jgi:hypothetical protein
MIGELVMTEIPEAIDPLARKLWDMSQRVGMRIADEPLEKRETAFATAERTVREMATQMGVFGGNVEAVVKLHMDLIRQTVTAIDVGGGAKGGHA